MSEILLQVENLSVVYGNGHEAVHDVNFQLTGGNCCALVGANGSGKSTVFNAIMGLVPVARGRVRLNGAPVAEALKHNGLAYVPQNDHIDHSFPILVEEVVMLGRYGHMNWRRRAGPEDRAKVREALERLAIAPLAKRQIGELSGGQRKRVFLARALAQESRVILLDEPFTGVDVQTEFAVMELLGELRQSGYLLLVSTHNLGAVPRFCNETILLNRTVIAQGPVQDIYNLANLELAFGSALKNVGLAGLNIISDDEHPAVFNEEGKTL